MHHSNVTVGLVQMSCVADKETNISKAISLIREAAGRGAQLVCLQELFASLYFCREEEYANFRLAEPVPGPSTKIFQELALDLGIVIVASLFEKRTRGLFHNTVAVIDADGTYLGKYRKHHIPDDPGYFEKFYFTPGDEGYRVFQTRFARIGVLICWDQWYPEAARITSLNGADILFFPTAIGWAGSQDEETNRQQFHAWQIIQRAHAIANGVFVVSVNRTGCEGEMNFWGGSFISDPFGDLLYQASHEEEVVHTHVLPLERIDEIRMHWPFLRDRRMDSYGDILKRYIDN